MNMNTFTVVLTWQKEMPAMSQHSDLKSVSEGSKNNYLQV